MKLPVALGFGTMVPGQPQLAVAGDRQEIELPLGTAHQHVGAGDVAAAREVEADERDLAGARGDAARARAGLDVGGQGRAARCAVRASMPSSEGPITVAEPVMKLCARNSRRVRGRG